MAKIKVQEVLQPLLENLEGMFEHFSLFIFLENFEDKLKKKNFLITLGCGEASVRY